MKKFVSWIVMIPLAVAVVAFSAANRDTVVISLWPVPYTIEAPLALIVLSAIAAGTVIGFLLALLSGGRARYRAKIQKSLQQNPRQNAPRDRREKESPPSSPGLAAVNTPTPPVVSAAVILPPAGTASGAQRPPANGA